MFFDCIESHVRQKRRQQNRIMPKDSIDQTKQTIAEKMVHGAIEDAASRRSINEVIQIKKHFQHMLDSEKAAILTKFVGNKEIMRSLYDLMFNQRKPMIMDLDQTTQGSRDK